MQQIKKQTILFGNGFNRLGSEDFGWNNVLKECRGQSDTYQGIPNTFQYEDMLLKDTMKLNGSHALENVENKLKSEIADRIGTLQVSQESLAVYDALFKIEADYYLTTNYDRTYEIGLQKNFFRRDNSKCSSSETAYNMRRREYWISDILNRSILLWPIHGKAYDMRTMMLGLDHYCGAITRMNNYMNSGKSHTKMHNDDYYDYCNYLKRKKYEQSSCPYMKYHIEHYQIKDYIQYWVDTFFLTDVHIIGFGMSFDEIDLWWMLNKRRRMIEQNCNIKNTIFFYGYASETIKYLLESYGVDVSFCMAESSATNNQESKEWLEIYNSNMKQIKNYIESAKRNY